MNIVDLVFEEMALNMKREAANKKRQATRAEKDCRRIVKERAQGRCERCGKTWPLGTIHHRRKRSHRGPWSPENCVYVCGHGTTAGGCHSWIEFNPNLAEGEGFHVRPWGDETVIPVLYRGKWVRLLPNGEIEECGTTQESD